MRFDASDEEKCKYVMFAILREHGTRGTAKLLKAAIEAWCKECDIYDAESVDDFGRELIKVANGA